VGDPLTITGAGTPARARPDGSEMEYYRLSPFHLPANSALTYAMRDRFPGFPLVSCLILIWGVIGAPAVPAQTPANTAPPGAATGNAGQGAPAATGTQGSSGATSQIGAAPATGSAAALKPAIAGIDPATPVIAPDQTLTLTGSNFQKDIAVTFTDPQGNSYKAVVLSPTDSTKMVVRATFGIGGTWKVSANNPGGSPSDPRELEVANSTPLTLTSPSFLAFALASFVVTGFMIGLFVFMLSDVRNSQKAGQWSFGDALSEESTYQPKDIRKKSDVIIFASTSRLIALIGLMGILGIVVGVGYSIMWSLFIHGTVPDLSGVRSFLYGAATLFAPYLANQLSSAFTPSAKTASVAAATAIAAVAPASPSTVAAAQPLHVVGTGFQTGASLTFTDPSGNTVSVAGADITDVGPTLISCNVVLNTAGSWMVAAANPATASSDAFIFSVSGPPTVTATNPAALTHNAAAQALAFTGSGFMSGLTVALTSPAPGSAAVTITPDSVTATSVAIKATLDLAGNWQAKISNPGNLASDAFSFTVA